MSALMVTAFAHAADRADVMWDGDEASTPVLDVAGVRVHLSQLGADLAPWLLALSARLAEFAESVGADGTRASGSGTNAAGSTARITSTTWPVRLS